MSSITRASSRVSGPFTTGAAVIGAIFCCLALSMVTAGVLAQGVVATPLQASSAAKLANPPAPTRASKGPMTSSQPNWQDLTPAQQLSLSPLAARWNSLNSAAKRKWIVLAANYSTLTPAQQAKLHSRMTEWASLSPKQRGLARLNFARSKQISPTQKAATWEAYQALSPEEKQKLAKSAPPKPAGAAMAAKPAAPDKLTRIPPRKPMAKQASEVPAVSQSVNRNTLLPHAKRLPEPKPAQQN